MRSVPLISFSNYMEAHISLLQLRDLNISCYLQDEHTVTIDPILTNAIGGIKLIVAEDQFEEAQLLLHQLQKQQKLHLSCPNCGSHDIEFISTPRKPINWFSSIFTWLFGSYPMSVEKTWHCFNCKAEFTEPVESENT